MLLSIDIGNSAIKLGIFDGSQRIYFKRIGSIKEIQSTIVDYEIRNIGISSVVPRLNSEISAILEKKFLSEPYFISHKSKTNLEILYETRDTLGVDRICGCEGAYNIYRNEIPDQGKKSSDVILAIDLGTATTINVIQQETKFVGGLIAPGIQLMSKSLMESTAQLPAVEINFDDIPIIGKSTISSIKSGLFYSVVGLIEHIHMHFSEEANVFTFLTGGNAPLFHNKLSFENRYIEDLVLKGVNSIYQLNHN